MADARDNNGGGGPGDLETGKGRLHAKLRGTPLLKSNIRPIFLLFWETQGSEVKGDPAFLTGPTCKNYMVAM